MTTGLAGLGAIVLIVALGATDALAQQPHYATGGLPTPPERRQSIPLAPAFDDFLPPAVDLSRYFPPVGDQLQQGSSVGWATGYAARGYYARQLEQRDINVRANIPSPAWLFNIIHRGKDCNRGAMIPDALEVLRRGARSLVEYPYDDGKCLTPLPSAQAAATDFRIDGYELVWDIARPDLDRVKGALAKGRPVVILDDLDASFFALGPRQSVWRASAAAPSAGGHAVTLVGYDDAAGVFKFINSWSARWGDGGFGRISYETFAARVYEGYVMRLPGDADIALQDADFVPDGIEAAPPPAPVVELGHIGCGQVEIHTDADGHTTATGFVGTETELARLSNLLESRVDVVDLALLPWPACEVRLTLAAALAETDLPQVAIDPEAPAVGDRLVIRIETPGFASYLHVGYLAADGTVITLAQPNSADLRAKPPHSVVRLGDPDAGQPMLTVAPPVGAEMLLVVASEQPLFARALADATSARAFLSALRAGLLSGAAGRVTASVQMVTTTE